jgi:hypothetical protein
MHWREIVRSNDFFQSWIQWQIKWTDELFWEKIEHSMAEDPETRHIPFNLSQYALNTIQSH